MAEFSTTVLRTNFFRSKIVALAFRLDPTKLKAAYPADTVPFGVYYVVGAEFRGFHVRFADVARGGIRIIKSGSAQALSASVGGMFDECYNLALTQQKKNKVGSSPGRMGTSVRRECPLATTNPPPPVAQDIVEGGSKGVILLNLAHQAKELVAFQKCVGGWLGIVSRSQCWYPHPTPPTTSAAQVLRCRARPADATAPGGRRLDGRREGDPLLRPGREHGESAHRQLPWQHHHHLHPHRARTDGLGLPARRQARLPLRCATASGVLSGAGVRSRNLTVGYPRPPPLTPPPVTPQPRPSRRASPRRWAASRTTALR